MAAYDLSKTIIPYLTDISYFLFSLTWKDYLYFRSQTYMLLNMSLREEQTQGGTTRCAITEQNLENILIYP